MRNGKREEQLLTEGNQSVTFIGPKPEKESNRGIIMRLPKEAEATLSLAYRPRRMDSSLSPSSWHRATLADQVAIPDREASGYLP